MSDIFLTDKGDGGSFEIESGDLKADDTFFTAIYLSLFQGKSFSNIFTEYETNTKFEDALNLPVTVTNINKVNTIGEKALNWLVNEGIAEKINFSAHGDKNSKLSADITVTEPQGEFLKYSIIWQNERAILCRAER